MTIPLLQVENLRKYFPIRGGVLQRVVNNLKAVDGISFDVPLLRREFGPLLKKAAQVNIMHVFRGMELSGRHQKEEKTISLECVYLRTWCWELCGPGFQR